MYVFSLLAFLTQLAAVAHTEEIATDDFPNHVMLDDNFRLRWNFNQTHIVFETQVNTTGYVGLGISHNGKMFPSDIAVGWVSNGQVNLEDRHATAKEVPVMDESQDWHLVNGSESNGQTTLVMIRSLDTCDEGGDIAIKEGTTRVIYAYGQGDSLLYHSTHRGTKSLLLLDPPSSERESKPLPDDVISIDFLHPSFPVPTADTTYGCTLFKLPELTQKHHVIRYEPVIPPAHDGMVHHMILYFCHGTVNESLLNTTYECYEGELDGTNCGSVFTGWAIGGESFNYPDHVGHSLGTDIDPTFFKLETHYDNPTGRSGLVDSSGLRLFLTKQLRQHDVGILMTGAAVSPYQIVPPHNTKFLARFYCHQDCLARGLNGSKIHVFAGLLHSHVLGRKLRTRVIRNGIELPPLQEDNNYDFNYQETRVLHEERVLEQGDSLIVECVYDSSQITGITYGGLGTSQEMCLTFLTYYPRNPLTGCFTTYTYNDVPEQFGDPPNSVFAYTRGLDWRTEASHKSFQSILDNSLINNICNGDSRLEDWSSVTPQVKVDVRYKPTDDACHNTTVAAPPPTSPTVETPYSSTPGSASPLSFDACRNATSTGPPPTSPTVETPYSSTPGSASPLSFSMLCFLPSLLVAFISSPGYRQH